MRLVKSSRKRHRDGETNQSFSSRRHRCCCTSCRTFIIATLCLTTTSFFVVQQFFLMQQQHNDERNDEDSGMIIPRVPGRQAEVKQHEFRLQDSLVDCTRHRDNIPTFFRDPNLHPPPFRQIATLKNNPLYNPQRPFQAVVNVTMAVAAHKSDSFNAFFLSLHNPKFDRVRWDIYEQGRYYERQMEKLWISLIKKRQQRLTKQNSNNTIHVWDVGGNIGYYTMLSAHLGSMYSNLPMEIDTFEPHPLNTLRACESLEWNDYWKPEGQDSSPSYSTNVVVNLWKVAVSNQIHSNYSFLQHENPGGGSLVDLSDAAWQRLTKGQRKQQEKRIKRHGLFPIPVVTLDYFWKDRSRYYSYPFIVEILKVDVERHEAQVLDGAQQVLEAGLVRNIFTELGADNLKDLTEQTESKTSGFSPMTHRALEILFDADYHICGVGGYRGPSDPSPIDDTLVHSLSTEQKIQLLFDYVAGRSKIGPFVNLWWQLLPRQLRHSNNVIYNNNGDEDDDGPPCSLD